MYRSLTHCIAVRRSFAAINDVDGLEREIKLLGQRKYAIPELALWQRCQLIEQWLDEGWVKDHGENLKGKEKNDDVGW